MSKERRVELKISDAEILEAKAPYLAEISGHQITIDPARDLVLKKLKDLGADVSIGYLKVEDLPEQNSMRFVWTREEAN